MRSLAIFILLVLAAVPAAVRANVCTSESSGAWSSIAVWQSGIVPAAGDTVIISAGDSVQLDESSPALNLLFVNGYLSLDSDTLYLRAVTDTAIIVSGTLDAAKGWFVNTQDTTWTLHLTTGSLFRAAAQFPPDSSSMFDTLHSPVFLIDPASTFEYYSQNNSVTDISYLLTNFPAHRYENLTLTNCVGTFRINPLTVHDTLHLNFGASLKADYNPQIVAINGNVINDNRGASGTPGAGLDGCGMLSLGADTWIFDAGNSGTKDTVHWVGPSQLGSVIVRSNTVLSVRFVDDTHCDSLDILTDLTEENPPCGGHLIGRAYVELSHTLNAANPSDTFGGLGIRIASGMNPWLGLTRVVRTSGYAPPGANARNVPLLRYFRVTTSAGPQSTPDTISMQVHCDELNGADIGMLHFWRSFDGGETWAFSGIESCNPRADIFTWDTTVLCWPNDSGNFLWMLSDGYVDIPLPVALEHFSAVREGSEVDLTWQTGYESQLAGFEIDRVTSTDSEMIGSYFSDDSLRSKSPSGAEYHFSDPLAPQGNVHYDLFEITDDAVCVWLGSETPIDARSDSLSIGNIHFEEGALMFTVSEPMDLTISVVDALGRKILTREIDCSDAASPIIPMPLRPGIYFVEISSGAHIVTSKVMVE